MGESEEIFRIIVISNYIIEVDFQINILNQFLNKL